MHSEFGALDVLPEPGPFMLHISCFVIVFFISRIQNMNSSEFFKIDVVEDEVEADYGILLIIDMCELEQRFLQDYTVLECNEKMVS